MNIMVMTKTLSDGSKVYDVVMSQDGQLITLPAVSANDAGGLVAKLADAIKDHTNEPLTLAWPA